MSETLGIGSIQFSPTCEPVSHPKIERTAKPIPLPFDPVPILDRYNAVQTMLTIVRRLVETATFTLSAEDYTALETALRDYDNANMAT